MKTLIRYMALSAFVIGNAGISQANEPGAAPSNPGYGVEEQMDNLEYEEEMLRHSKGEEGGNFAVDIPQSVDAASPEALSKLSERAAGNCSRVWTKSSHRWRYSDYVPNVYLKVKLWVDSKSYLGSPGDPLSCFERWYYSDRITNNGEVNGDGNCSGCARPVLARIANHSRNNEAVLNSYKKARSYGSAAVTPRCGYSKHTYVINGSTYNYTRRSGYCAY